MITTAIIGASGYSGAELLKLLSRRSDVSVARLAAHASAGKKVRELYPVFGGTVDSQFETVDAVLSHPADIVFTALPSGESMAVMPVLREMGRRVIDLSGDFRLPDAGLYTQYYQRTHTAPELLRSAVYGLPEIFGDRIARAGLVANPGCYPTSILLPLIPLVREAIVKTEGITITSLSGISGAGRSASVEFSFSEINENVRAYKVGSHQHIPEIESILQRATGRAAAVSFIPLLVPLTRGMYTTIHAQLARETTVQEIYDVLEAAYGSAPFVRIRRDIPALLDAAHTNYCDIHPAVNTRTNQVVLLSVIDNLVKGAAGQAMQNMNIMFGLPETAGLR